MSTKLTLRMNPLLIKEAKHYAGQQKKTRIPPRFPPLPLTRSLRGVIKAEDLSNLDYQAYLENKYL